MTTVEVIRQGDHYTAHITGHAGFSRAGEPDIVCSAVSVLSFALMQTVQDYQAAGIVEEANIQYTGGNVWMDWTVRNQLPDLTCIQAAVSALFRGFELLSKKYPENVTIMGGGGARDFWPCDTLEIDSDSLALGNRP